MFKQLTKWHISDIFFKFELIFQLFSINIAQFAFFLYSTIQQASLTLLHKLGIIKYVLSVGF